MVAPPGVVLRILASLTTILVLPLRIVWIGATKPKQIVEVHSHTNTMPRCYPALTTAPILARLSNLVLSFCHPVLIVGHCPVADVFAGVPFGNPC